MCVVHVCVCVCVCTSVCMCVCVCVCVCMCVVEASQSCSKEFILKDPNYCKCECKVMLSWVFIGAAQLPQQLLKEFLSAFNII